MKVTLVLILFSFILGTFCAPNCSTTIGNDFYNLSNLWYSPTTYSVYSVTDTDLDGVSRTVYFNFCDRVSEIIEFNECNLPNDSGSCEHDSNGYFSAGQSNAWNWVPYSGM